ncbi:MAG: ThiF family adenylyltransferase [Candidatus Sericytochromatia bacterium]|nr:ThiF family adenylyltransferase [Candidatus Sericytochromatia bacterium]
MSNQNSSRYSRQISLPEVGQAGQAQLQSSRVLIVGAGGLGCPAALYLAAAGVGHLGLIDPDQVALSNLQRQILYTPSDLGKAKVTRAAERLMALNPELQIQTFALAVDAENAIELVKNWDIVVDGSDQLPVRYWLNAACLQAGIPLVYGSLYRFAGQLSVLGSPGPCYRCLFPELPSHGSIPDCNTGGVLGAMAGLVGTLQALETLKFLLGQPCLQGELLLIEGLSLAFEKVSLSRDPDCPGCGPNPRPLLGQENVSQRIPEVQASELENWLESHPHLQILDLRPVSESNLHEDALPMAFPGRHLPLEELPSQLHSLQQGEPVLLFCQRGVRSQAGGQLLLKAGFQKVVHLQGGIDAWHAFQSAQCNDDEIIL